MYSMRLEWKEFNISLENFEAHMRANFPAYLGNQAASDLTLYFDQELTEQEAEEIQDHWDLLDGSDYFSAQDLAAQAEELKQAVADMKVALLVKTWDQMTTTERKVAMNMEVSRAEMGLE